MTHDLASMDPISTAASRRKAHDGKVALGIIAGAVAAALAASAFALIAPSLPKARDVRADATDDLSKRWALESALDLQAAVDGAAHSAQRADGSALAAAEMLSQARLLETRRPVNVGETSLADGSFYVGELNDGAPQGVGLARSRNGAFTAGAFVKGVRVGLGVECRREDCVTASYFGDFRDNAPSGVGRIRFPDGSVYRGEVRAGAPEGFGELTRTDGSSYAGGFLAGQRNGYGVDRSPDGTPKAGFWAEDKLMANTRDR